jgi:hypothetical protein
MPTTKRWNTSKNRYDTGGNGGRQARQREVAAKKMGEAKCVDSLPDPNIDLWADIQKKTECKYSNTQRVAISKYIHFTVTWDCSPSLYVSLGTDTLSLQYIYRTFTLDKRLYMYGSQFH